MSHTRLIFRRLHTSTTGVCICVGLSAWCAARYGFWWTNWQYCFMNSASISFAAERKKSQHVKQKIFVTCHNYRVSQISEKKNHQFQMYCSILSCTNVFWWLDKACLCVLLALFSEFSFNVIGEKVDALQIFGFSLSKGFSKIAQPPSHNWNARLTDSEAQTAAPDVNRTANLKVTKLGQVLMKIHLV